METVTQVAPSDWSDETLVELMLTKSALAWREFHRRFDRLVFRCIHKVTCRFSSSVGSDDVREIYAQFLLSITQRDMHKIRSFDRERGNKLSSWVGLLATNCAWDHLRGISRQAPTVEISEVENVDGNEGTPFDHLLEKERWGRVNETLRTFSQKDRVFVRLYYMDGLSPEEVAEEMSISVKTVYSKKHKIRCRLERALLPIMRESMDRAA